jgi:hypothetical protein
MSKLSESERFSKTSHACSQFEFWLQKYGLRLKYASFSSLTLFGDGVAPGLEKLSKVYRVDPVVMFIDRIYGALKE